MALYYRKHWDTMQDFKKVFSRLKRRLDSFISTIRPNGWWKTMPVLTSISKKDVSIDKFIMLQDIAFQKM